MSRPLSAVLLLGALLALVAGCGPDGASASAAQAGVARRAEPDTDRARVFRFGTATESVVLDPHLAWGVPDFRVLNHLFEPLVRLDERAEPQPALAEQWHHDGTFQQWTFHLRQNARWHNGDLVTADDFVFGIRRVLLSSTGAPSASQVADLLEGGRAFLESEGRDDSNLGVRAADPYTLEFLLNHPTPWFPTLVSHPAWYPLHQPSLQRAGPDWFRSPDRLIGNGPFRLADLRSGSRLVLRRAETFWDVASVFFEQLEFVVVAGPEQELAAFEAGELDMTESLSAAAAQRFAGRPEYVAAPALAVGYLLFNMTTPPFDSRDMRQAVSLSLDRRALVARALPAGHRATGGIVPRGMRLADGRVWSEVAPPPIDPAAQAEAVLYARRHLMRLGFIAGGESPAPFRIDYVASATNESVVAALKELWNGSVNLQATARPLDWNAYSAALRSGDFQVARFTWFADYVSPLAFLELFASDSSQNFGGYASAEFDDLLHRARIELDPDKRARYFAEAERRLVAEDAVVAPLYEVATVYLQRPEIEGAFRTPLGGLDVTRARRR
ncbi:MAG: peptide ABC transporter substrate-binding protein [Candidatus Sumerlaeia bacterium]|nr:peptide ABC transporter substrate-binding protein [Candidatus Sumerlaeia bacterium]